MDIICVYQNVFTLACLNRVVNDGVHCKCTVHVYFYERTKMRHLILSVAICFPLPWNVRQKAIAVGDIKMTGVTIQTEMFCLALLWLWGIINVSASCCSRQSYRRTCPWMFSWNARTAMLHSQHMQSVAGVVWLKMLNFVVTISASRGKWSHVKGIVYPK